MYAIIETGGKQYKVSEGTTIDVEKVKGSEDGSVEFDKILLISYDDDVKTGNPHIDGAKVVGKIVKQAKAPKILVFKFKPKRNYRRRYGHRQPYTRVKIEQIVN